MSLAYLTGHDDDDYDNDDDDDYDDDEDENDAAAADDAHIALHTVNLRASTRSRSLSSS